LLSPRLFVIALLAVGCASADRVRPKENDDDAAPVPDLPSDGAGGSDGATNLAADTASLEAAALPPADAAGSDAALGSPDAAGPDAAPADATAPDRAIDQAVDVGFDAPVPIDTPADRTPDSAKPDLAADAAKPDAAADLPRPDAAPDLPPPDAAVGDAGPSSTRQVPRYTGSTASANGYYEYLPPGYGDGQPRPLLTFWHGQDQNGNGSKFDLGRVALRGPPLLIANNQWPADRPFVVLSPQHDGTACPPPDEIRNFIAFALANYQVDPKRVYLTGLSCGASGGWDYLAANLGSQVVAAVLIAGVGTPAWSKAGCALGAVAIWGFHGDADNINPVAGTRDPLTALMACPMPPRRDARLTIYPGVGHYDTWGPTYDLSAGHDIYAWMLSQSK